MQKIRMFAAGDYGDITAGVLHHALQGDVAHQQALAAGAGTIRPGAHPLDDGTDKRIALSFARRLAVLRRFCRWRTARLMLPSAVPAEMRGSSTGGAAAAWTARIAGLWLLVPALPARALAAGDSTPARCRAWRQVEPLAAGFGGGACAHALAASHIARINVLIFMASPTSSPWPRQAALHSWDCCNRSSTRNWRQPFRWATRCSSS